jgi:hypothetical protein
MWKSEEEMLELPTLHQLTVIFFISPVSHDFPTANAIVTYWNSECRDSCTQPELQLCRGCMECTVR